MFSECFLNILPVYLDQSELCFWYSHLRFRIILEKERKLSRLLFDNLMKNRESGYKASTQKFNLSNLNDCFTPMVTEYKSHTEFVIICDHLDRTETNKDPYFRTRPNLKVQYMDQTRILQLVE